jgi:hypothetical protein
MNTEQKHSKLPWIVTEYPFGRQCFVQATRNKETEPYDIKVLGDDLGGDLYPYEQKKADAQRIVDCVNALAGIDRPVAWVKEIDRAYHEVTQQRDELLAALENFCHRSNIEKGDSKTAYEAVINMATYSEFKSLIAKVKGETT